METEVNVKTTEPVKPAPVPIIRRRKHGLWERFPWQRLTLSLLGISVLIGIWRWSVNHLYSLPDQSISAFTSITNNIVYALAALVIFFVTGRLVYEWKNQTVSEVVQQTQNLFEKREEKSEQVITVRTEGGAKAFLDEGLNIP